MGKSRDTANLVADINVFSDVTNDRVGVGISSPTTKLDVNGTIKATSFIGSGSSLTGLPSGYSDLDNMLFG